MVRFTVVCISWNVNKFISKTAKIWKFCLNIQMPGNIHLETIWSYEYAKAKTDIVGFIIQIMCLQLLVAKRDRSVDNNLHTTQNQPLEIYFSQTWKWEVCGFKSCEWLLKYVRKYRVLQIWLYVCNTLLIYMLERKEEYHNYGHYSRILETPLFSWHTKVVQGWSTTMWS